MRPSEEEDCGFSPRTLWLTDNHPESTPPHVQSDRIGSSSRPLSVLNRKQWLYLLSRLLEFIKMSRLFFSWTTLFFSSYPVDFLWDCAGSMFCCLYSSLITVFEQIKVTLILSTMFSLLFSLVVLFFGNCLWSLVSKKKIKNTHPCPLCHRKRLLCCDSCRLCDAPQHVPHSRHNLFHSGLTFSSGTEWHRGNCFDYSSQSHQSRAFGRRQRVALFSLRRDLLIGRKWRQMEEGGGREGWSFSEKKKKNYWGRLKRRRPLGGRAQRQKESWSFIWAAHEDPVDAGGTETERRWHFHGTLLKFTTAEENEESLWEILTAGVDHSVLTEA